MSATRPGDISPLERSTNGERVNRRMRAMIIGAGPAGLTAAFELITRTNIQPIVLEKSEYMGGISRTVNYKGNRIDIGGHRFFSKSDRVMQWWLNILPLQDVAADRPSITYRRQSATVAASAEASARSGPDRVMLLRERKSRIYFMRRFFTYPISLNADTIRKLGFMKTLRIGLSYLRSATFPIRPERNLEEFFQNRFGRKLYLTFFKSYTEKVWGVDCKQISAEWGAQRIKGLSVLKALTHVLKKIIRPRTGLAQKNVETSLIEQFLYPKFGPGQMWEEVACQVRMRGGHIETGWSVDRVEHCGFRIQSITARNAETGEQRRFEGDYFFSTMPVKELIGAMQPSAPPHVREIAEGLVYRDFITVGVLCDSTNLRDTSGELIRDNWIYIQEPDVLVGRIQIFNNWSPDMVSDPSKVWLGLEYFCNDTDPLWSKSDQDVISLAMNELEAMNLVQPDKIVDATVIRMPKAYPAYFGTYERFNEIVDWVNRFDNLFLIGRNGMHKYNNQDHSMLTGMTAVDNIIGNVRNRANLWDLNTEQEYHEESRAAAAT